MRSTRRPFLPGAQAFPTAPVSPDAVLLSAVYVDPAYRGGGLGRMLVQGMARDLLQRGGIRAVEAFGDAHGRPGCLVPADFLASVGFKTQRPHTRTPRMRMDLRTTLSWRDELEQAFERLLGAVRPQPKPQPDAPLGSGLRSGLPGGLGGGPRSGLGREWPRGARPRGRLTPGSRRAR
ncbi:MAG: GNAT family N-acetyltransferase [Nocardioides sp.]